MIGEHYYDEDKAREYLQRSRWPANITCPHCGGKEVYKLNPKPGYMKHVRKGVFKCKQCRRQFTVSINTIFEGSHIPLHKWLVAIHLLCSSEDGISIHQVHRTLGITYRTAWLMSHRIYSLFKQIKHKKSEPNKKKKNQSNKCKKDITLYPYNFDEAVSILLQNEKRNNIPQHKDNRPTK